MSTESSFPTAEDFLALCCALLGSVNAIRRRGVVPEAEVTRIMELYEQIRTLSRDEGINRIVVEARRRVPLLTYGQRSRVLHGLGPNHLEWKAELRVLEKTCIGRREITKAREAGRKYFAKHAKQRPTEAHPLDHDKPVVEATDLLGTNGLCKIGRSQLRLSRDQNDHRNALLKRERRLLRSLILLVANALANQPSAYEISYTLAVFDICEA